MATLTEKALKGQTAGQIISELSEELNQTQLAWLSEQAEDKVITAPQAANLLKMEDNDAEGSEERVFKFSSEHKPGKLVKSGTQVSFISDPKAQWHWEGEGANRRQVFSRKGSNVESYTLKLKTVEHGEFEINRSLPQIAVMMEIEIEELEFTRKKLGKAEERFIKGLRGKTFVVRSSDMYWAKANESTWTLDVPNASPNSTSGRAIAAFEALSEEEKATIGTDTAAEAFCFYSMDQMTMDIETRFEPLKRGVKDVFLAQENIEAELDIVGMNYRLSKAEKRAKLLELKELFEDELIEEDEYKAARKELLAK